MKSNAGPLEGFRVVDFTWAAMGPYAGYLLAGLGAEVIQVSRPLKGSSSTTAAITQFFDVGKTCVKINVKDDEGKQILMDLIENSDIFLENFRPGVVEGLGLDFETLKKINPDLVMISGSALGRGGPDSSYVGYAPVFSALSGLADSTGFEDGRPTEIRYPSDLTSGAAMAFAAIVGAADKQGKGTYVDLAARDALSWTLTSSFAMSTDVSSQRLGNGHPVSFPHGVYRCAGHDQWVSVSVSSETQLAALLELIGWIGAAGNDVIDISESDKKGIESALESWTSTHDIHEAVSTLQSIGVAAFASVDARDIWEDKHLRSRDFFRYVEDIGWVAAPPWRLEGGRGHKYRVSSAEAAREHVFKEILGIKPDVIQDLLQRGVIG